MVMKMKKIMEYLQHYINQYPHRLALVFEDRHLTYGELSKEIYQASMRYKEVKLNKKVGLMDEHPVNNIINYFAVHQRGGIPCIFNHQWSNERIYQLVKSYDIQWLIKDNHLTSNHDNSIYNDEVIPRNVIHIGFTSGTTGLPKAFYRNEHSWIVSFKENEKLLQHCEETIVAPGPLSHSLSLYECIYALSTGKTFIGQKNFNPLSLMRLINQLNKATAIFVVPTMVQQLISTQRHCSSIKSILSSGAKLTLQQFQQIRNLYPQANLIEFFGTSEASFISYNFNQSSPANSVGKLFPHVETRLLNQDDDAVGLLAVRSEMVFSGYVGQSNQEGAWIKTGDFAYIKNQHLFLVGRESDRIIVGGINVYPTAIESLIMDIEGIDEALVIGIPHAKFGEIAILLYSGKVQLNYRQIKFFLMKHLSRQEVPSKLKKIDHMIYTESGKIARKEMKNKFINGEL